MSVAGISDTLFWAALVFYGLATAAFFVAIRREAPGAMRSATGRVALGLTIAGAAIHLGMIVTRAVAAGRVPWGNMYEYSAVLVFLLVVAMLAVVSRRPSLRAIEPFAMLVGVVTMVLARGLYAPAGPLQPALQSWWLKIHVISAIAASSIFSIAFVFTVAYLIKERAERRALFTGSTVGAAYAGPAVVAERGGAGFPADHLDADPDAGADAPPGRGLAARLPKSSTLDAWSYRLTAVAFPIWTWAVIAGAIWAAKAWSRYWAWDPKETWAFITWVIYAAYLHARATSGWRGRRAAVVAVAGFVSLWITYYVVNLWIVGLHSYAGT
ncbi:MAG TPA: c-type cytochrome biogenesis protein CcsB [Actinomycetota bacterium]